MYFLSQLRLTAHNKWKICLNPQSWYVTSSLRKMCLQKRNDNKANKPDDIQHLHLGHGFICINTLTTIQIWPILIDTLNKPKFKDVNEKL